ncbi:MAG: hypothetical protein ACHQU1_02645 [Gemmatimonadales bacterium]
MRSLSEAGPTSELVCVKDGWFSRDYDFLLDGQRCGTIEWERGFQPQCVAETDGRAWWLRRPGMLSAQRLIGESGSETPIATFRRRFIGPAEITFADGRVFRWRRPRRFTIGFQFVIEAPSGDRLLEFGTRWGLWRPTVRIEVLSDATRPTYRQDIPILIMFGTYLLINAINQSSYG